MNQLKLSCLLLITEGGSIHYFELVRDVFQAKSSKHIWSLCLLSCMYSSSLTTLLFIAPGATLASWAFLRPTVNFTNHLKIFNLTDVSRSTNKNISV